MSVCNVHSNISLHFLKNFSTGNLGVLFARISMTTQAGDLIQNCRSSSSKVVVGNSGLD